MKDQSPTPEPTTPAPSNRQPEPTTLMPRNFLLAGLRDHFIPLAVSVTFVILVAFRTAAAADAPIAGPYTAGPDQRLLHNLDADNRGRVGPPTFPGAPTTGPPQDEAALSPKPASNEVDGTAGLHMKRQFTIEDLLGLEGVAATDFAAYGGPYSISDAPSRLAVALTRSPSSSPSVTDETFGRNSRADVWLQTQSNGTLMNITNGASDGSAWWAPQWSPDGSSLAMLTTRNPSGLAIWNASSHVVRALYPRLPIQDSGQPYVWIDPRTLLYLARSEDTPAEVSIIDAAKRTGTQWLNAARGELTTSSAIAASDSIGAARTASELVMLHLDGRHEVMATNVTTQWLPDIAHSRIAFVGLSAVDTDIGQSNEAQVVKVFDLTRRHTIVAPVKFSSIVPNTLRWSPDGTRLAWIGRELGEDINGTALYIFDANRFIVQRTRSDGVDLFVTRRVVWLTNHTLVIDALASTRQDEPCTRFVDCSPAGKAAEAQRSRNSLPQREWYRVTRGKLQAFGLPAADCLVPVAGQTYAATISTGQLWHLGATGKAKHIAPVGTQHHTRTLWPTCQFSSDGAPRMRREDTRSIAVVDSEAQGTRVVVDLITGRRTDFRGPSQSANFVAFSPTTLFATYVQDDGEGLRIWTQQGANSRPKLVHEANLSLRDVAPASWKLLSYRAENGEPLNAWVMLPYAYRAGVRYPLIVAVYPTAVFSSEPPDLGLSSASLDQFPNMQLAAAHGYAVLFPSMPFASGTDDPLPSLSNGVLPAVDAALDSGLADPAKLFLIGHSFGGYAVQGLITETSRFRAAVSIAGFSDLTSLYGVFDGNLRHGSAPHFDSRMLTILTAGPVGMRVPPWKDQARYIRNSPLLRVASVQTPIMIVHGDMDFVPITQSEEFFRALREEKKKAVLVRYLGERHIFQSPANIRDLWTRIFQWFSQ